MKLHANLRALCFLRAIDRLIDADLLVNPGGAFAAAIFTPEKNVGLWLQPGVRR
ncbi:MAG: hypothetical protein JWP27_2946 [Flaviaesturariibacter sp.]|nr:hypothetical protein [Flaviaesturariibacter sp.]